MIIAEKSMETRVRMNDGNGSVSLHYNYVNSDHSICRDFWLDIH